MGDTNESAVMFETAFSALHKTLGPRLDGPLREGFRSLGVDFDRLQPAYSMETWEAGLTLISKQLFPSLGREEAYRQIGRDFLKGYVQTRLGQATLMVGKVLGVRRMMHRMERNFRTATNTSNITVTDVGDHLLEMVIALVPRFLPTWRGVPLSLPHYRRGLLEGIITVLGAQGTVDMVSTDLELQRTVYRIAWS